LSQSRAANSRANHSGGHSEDLKSLDLLFALLLHLMIFTIIGVLIYWQQQHRIEPLKRIEVMMISAKQLAKLEHPSHRKARRVKLKPVKAQPVIKPVVKPRVKKTVAKKVVKTKVKDNFDPFAPLASTTDRTISTKRASTSRPELANLAGKQLTSSEKERYIALMQAAVQEHWKLSASATKFADPLVQMQLLPNGAVASVKILESSGNATIDASLIRAIQAAAPFELPRQQFEFFRFNRIRFHPLK